jgi:hypothetical protein
VFLVPAHQRLLSLQYPTPTPPRSHGHRSKHIHAGESAFNLAALAESSEPAELSETLLPVASKRSDWLLEVLAVREDDAFAKKFVQERRSKILGRANDGSKVG